MLDRLKRRVFPLLATIGLLAAGMYTTTWGPAVIGRSQWAPMTCGER